MTPHIRALPAPLVSIVIPTYNRAALLPEAIESALGQQYPSLEILVVDDGSTDQTERLLASYGDRIVAIRLAKGGLAAARNAGLRAAHGKYVAWLDSDDIFLPEKTALQVAFLEKHAAAVLVSSDFAAFDDRGPRTESVRTYYHALRRVPGGLEAIYPTVVSLEYADIPWLRQAARPEARAVVRVGNVYDHLLGGSFIHPPTVLMRRNAALAAGELDARLANSFEYRFFFNLAGLGPFAFIDQPLLRYRYSEGQLSSEQHSLSMQLSILQIIMELPLQHPELVRHAGSAYRRRLASCHLGAALELADSRRGEALFHLLWSLRHFYADSRTPRTLARLALPAAARRMYRRLRR